jgi:hypothetical protein
MLRIITKEELCEVKFLQEFMGSANNKKKLQREDVWNRIRIGVEENEGIFKVENASKMLHSVWL